MAMETINLIISGMECDACAGHVLRALRAVTGVVDADVSFSGRLGRVAYDPALATESDLRYAVQEEGYEAELQPR